MSELKYEFFIDKVVNKKYFANAIPSYLRYLIIIYVLIIPHPVYADNGADADRNYYSQEGSFEIGGTFGTPSGLNSRYWITEKIGFDSSAGISLNKYPVFTIDLLIEQFRIYRSSTWESKFFYGFGCLLAKEEEFKNNLRIPLGFSFPLLRFPINFSFYVAPAFVFNPEREYELNWGIGIRYNFTRAAAIRKRQDLLEREVDKLERNVENLERGLDVTKDKLAETEGELSITRGKLNKLTERLETIKERLGKTEGELGKTKTRLDETEGELDKTKTKLDITEGELGKTKTKLFLTTEELNSTKNQLDDVQNELKNTKKDLDDKQSELTKKQIELDKARNIIENAFTGKEKEEEEKKLALKQKQLDEQLAELNKEKQNWEKIKEEENERREQLKSKCEERGGIIDENGYCVCPENKEWDKETDRCVCTEGYYTTADGCEPCEIIKYNGKCADQGCEEDENKVRLKKGPHKYVCIKKCRRPNEVWSSRKKACVCKDGYYRNDKGECVPRL